MSSDVLQAKNNKFLRCTDGCCSFQFVSCVFVENKPFPKGPVGAKKHQLLNTASHVLLQDVLPDYKRIVQVRPPRPNDMILTLGRLAVRVQETRRQAVKLESLPIEVVLRQCSFM